MQTIDCPCGSGAAYAGCCGRLHERSRFERRRGRWVYVDGEVS